MFEDDEKPIRYHLTEDFALERGERVFLDKRETGTVDWVRQCEVSEDAKTPELLQAVVREIAITRGGEAWRAMTERSELLCLFSVYKFAMELNCKKTITMHSNEQYFLGVAQGWLDLPPPC